MMEKNLQIVHEEKERERERDALQIFHMEIYFWVIYPLFVIVVVEEKLIGKH